jgi:hypothetical protein
LQATPFNAKDVGEAFAPLNDPLKPAVKVPPLAMLAFHGALLATVTFALFAA